jgi:5-methyltetrahydropteroyltriglutamate--homocysteine methyltransferase
MTKVRSSNLGYPRIGEKREWKKALEQYWEGKLEEATFLKQMEDIRLHHLQKQMSRGIDIIPVGDFSLYDHVLDTAVMFGLIPKRFNMKGGKITLDTYFDIARGTKDEVASEMTKWFNTNYHYIVPELNDCKPALLENRPLQFYKEAKHRLGINGKAVILGPMTFVYLSKGFKQNEFQLMIHQLVPLYADILRELEAEGAEWVQLDEPILSTTLTKREIDLFKDVYKTLHEAAPTLKIILQTYFEGLDHYEEIISLPVQGIGLDFVHDQGQNLLSLKKYGFPKDKVLAAGVIDGRNVWRANLEEKISILDEISETVPIERVIIQPSSSLLHVPITIETEEELTPISKEVLSFADEKLHEINILSKGFKEGKETIQKEILESVNAVQSLKKSSFRNNLQVHNAIQQLTSYKVERDVPFDVRQTIQKKAFQLPLLPTTTIGSFPQTQEVRSQRLKWRNGQLEHAEYREFIKGEIKKWIDIQEEIGLDVLVHGEFERTDMVEFFGEKLEGFLFTKYGWVQSYGSRCVKPPLIFGDVSYNEAMTIEETAYAQSLTNKPVKGMLTGPITILNWSFVRDDIPRFEVANQIALALKMEVINLEQSGIRMIQVDEPALREGLPLKQEKRKEYLEVATFAFKLATGSVQTKTQIHTHMCYCEFEDIIDAIKALDADVISIEASRSHGELIHAFELTTYDKGIGLGVYDIHSPRIPKLDEVKSNINRALQVLDSKQFWINPDCGLKTRRIDEAVAGLKVMVKAAKDTREKLLLESRV